MSKIRKATVIFLTLFLALYACDRRPGKKTQPDTPFASTPHKLVREMLKLADAGKDDVVYDLGSGDGRIVITAARDFGSRGVGIELDGELISESRKKASMEGVDKKVKFIQEDFFETDLKEATVVTLYLLPEINELLLPKLIKELKPGSRVVSHMWGLGDWEPDKTLHAYEKTLYMWFVPARIQGEWKVTFKSIQNEAVKECNISVKQRYQKLEAMLEDGKNSYRFTHSGLYGNEINLYTSYAREGKTFVVSLEGVVKGNTMEGRASIKEFEKNSVDEYTWVAKRVD